ncbi:TIR domain-containing protein [Komagataeibacter nataicola]|uniref:toll/interleukin-1 receptor domain-containing protein n=1 Tax=Komagataeibacter nataicola TaxID=265960 RepID=UPI0011B4AB99|nr:toll/interleukin-1 receptor domain-containing protein [Komagataeibacter nataicola]WNM07531.1 toll/interleukin-1 receptor domain-containing protein [Komagataeibacter nataicola]GBR21963.1 hypothetical protein AA0616_2158 [Komagataeibacter nataicola NRIC 0616]
MYKAYKIDIDGQYLGVNQDIIENIKLKNMPKQSIKNFFNVDGSLDGNNIISEWFPQEKFDIFLSHSHADEQIAYMLANFLEENFGLRCFVDSSVWGYADKILKEVDEEFCKKEDNKGIVTYSYEKRNITTSHIHNMLSVSITSMMNQCECLFFLNTKNSLIKKDNIKNLMEGETYSPWLYYELSMCLFLEKIVPKRFIEKNMSIESMAMDEARTDSVRPVARYFIQTEYMTTLDDQALNNWAGSYGSGSIIKGINCLDWIYKYYPMSFPVRKIL